MMSLVQCTKSTFNWSTHVSWPVWGYLLVTLYLLTPLPVAARLTASHSYGSWTNHMITAGQQKSARLSNYSRCSQYKQWRVPNVTSRNIFNIICTKKNGNWCQKRIQVFVGLKSGIKGSQKQEVWKETTAAVDDHLHAKYFIYTPSAIALAFSRGCNITLLSGIG